MRTELGGIDAVNEADPDGLARLLAPLFEDPGPLTPLVAAARPFASWTALVDAAEAGAARLDEADRVALLRAHPRLGTDPATLASRSALSHAEQGAADPEADRALAELNDAYEARFGFPFVEFVAGRPRSALVEVLRERLDRSRSDELAAGLAAVFAIARDRLARLTGEGRRG